MTLRDELRAALLRVYLGPAFIRLRRSVSEMKRRMLGRKRELSVFVELDDPYSYLLCSYLAELEDYYDVELRLYLTRAAGDEFRPAPKLYADYAIQDCRRLADALGIAFLDRGGSPPAEQRGALLAALLAVGSRDSNNENIVAAMTDYWRGDADAVAERARAAGDEHTADEVLEANQRKLRRLGHYNTAMIHYGGEWYWGVDRLHFLIDRLDDLGAGRRPGLAPRIASIRRVMRARLPDTPPTNARNLPPIELFHSFRSPYSYLLLARIMRIADAFGAMLDIRPVLPMVMRGMRVPRAKLLYILADAGREARERGIPFGRVRDPIGAGVERCMAVFEFARREMREREFAVLAGRAIWSSGIDLASDDGMRRIAGEAGLAWADVSASLGREEWRLRAEENRAAMMAAGCWGVPTVRIGDWVCWGQDRDWLIARRLEELCDTAEGAPE